jgi:hypothetical protein
MKYLIFIIFTIVSLIVTYLIYNTQFSEYAVIGRRNEKLSEKVKIGMSLLDVTNIMGKPQRVGSYGSLAHYDYPSNNGDFMDIEILIDSTGTVVNVFNPSKEPYWLKDNSK